jgi:hypothetical protein
MQAATKNHEEQIWDAGLQQLTQIYRNRIDGELDSYIHVLLLPQKLKFNRAKPLDADVRAVLIKLHKFVFS